MPRLEKWKLVIIASVAGNRWVHVKDMGLRPIAEGLGDEPVLMVDSETGQLILPDGWDICLGGECYDDEKMRFVDGGAIYTSNVIALNFKERWAQTIYTRYILGEPSSETACFLNEIRVPIWYQNQNGVEEHEGEPPEYPSPSLNKTPS